MWPVCTVGVQIPGPAVWVREDGCGKGAKSGLPSAPQDDNNGGCFLCVWKTYSSFVSVTVTGSLEIKGLEDAHNKQEEAELGCSFCVSWARLGSILSPTQIPASNVPITFFVIFTER